MATNVYLMTRPSEPPAPETRMVNDAFLIALRVRRQREKGRERKGRGGYG